MRDSNSENKLHVLFLCSWFPNSENPTLGNFVEKHAEAAARHNKISTLAVFPRKQDKKYEIETITKNGINSTIIYYRKVKTTMPFVKQMRKWNRYKKACEIGFDSINKTQKVDITHLNVVYPLGFFAAKLKNERNIPYVVTEHSTAYAPGHNQMSKSKLMFCQRILQNADRILPVSADLGQELKKLASDVPQQIVSNVVDENTFLEKEGIQEDKTHFIHISHAYDPHKNLSGIIQVAAKLKEQDSNFLLTIISDGDTSSHKKLAQQLNLNEDNIVFESTKTTEEVALSLQKADALVLFSNYENFPCVIAESMMTGTPVISTDVNGIPEYINERNGILVHAKDEKALLSAMQSIMFNSKEYNKSELRSYAMQHFSYTSVGKALTEVYHDVLNHD